MKKSPDTVLKYSDGFSDAFFFFGTASCAASWKVALA
jgi:hypothetical protein